jgi:type IV pilus assembly protein PilW
MELTSMGFRQDQHGFTLVEIMIAISISAVITSAFYQIFLSQQRSYLLQEQVAEMQQNLRTGLYMMVRDIRSAGKDAELAGLTRFVTDFASPNDIFGTDPIDYTVDTGIIAFTTDADDSGTIDATRAEMIAYRLNGNELQRLNIQQVDPTLQWETVAANIDALNFVLLAQDGTVTTDPNTVAAVEITLLVRTGQKDTQKKNHYTNTLVYRNKRGQDICPACDDTEENRRYRRRLLSTTVAVRN